MCSPSYVCQLSLTLLWKTWVEFRITWHIPWPELLPVVQDEQTSTRLGESFSYHKVVPHSYYGLWMFMVDIYIHNIYNIYYNIYNIYIYIYIYNIYIYNIYTIVYYSYGLPTFTSLKRHHLSPPHSGPFR